MVGIGEPRIDSNHKAPNAARLRTTIAAANWPSRPKRSEKCVKSFGILSIPVANAMLARPICVRAGAIFAV